MTDHTDHTDRARLRASDADREATAAHLREALAEGRLDIDEYQRRLDDAFAARTLGDLEPLTADLPPPVPATRDEATPATAERTKKSWVKEWRDWLGVALILNAIWLITSIAAGEPIFYWPMFPLGIWAAVNLASLLWDDDEDDG
ncbi:MAG TPA: DUF1707 domain-containing protein [Egibacteraceae bacterium]